MPSSSWSSVPLEAKVEDLAVLLALHIGRQTSAPVKVIQPFEVTPGRVEMREFTRGGEAPFSCFSRSERAQLQQMFEAYCLGCLKGLLHRWGLDAGAIHEAEKAIAVPMKAQLPGLLEKLVRRFDAAPNVGALRTYIQWGLRRALDLRGFSKKYREQASKKKDPDLIMVTNIDAMSVNPGEELEEDCGEEEDPSSVRAEFPASSPGLPKSRRLPGLTEG